MSAPGLHVTISLPQSWRVRCEVPGRLWFGVTYPDHAWPYRRVEVWHCQRLAAQLTADVAGVMA